MRYIRSHAFVLGTIFLLALLIRLLNLDSLPLGFHRDEVMNGYVGRYILENGVDLYNNAWPLLYFDNFGDFPNVIPMYLSGLFTYIFGPTMFGIRFPIALLGALTVFPLYGIITHVFQKRWLGLAGALLLAITPWHIVLSRATAEGITAGCVFLTAIWLLITSLKPVKRLNIACALVLFVLTYFLYPSYRILVPLTWLGVPFLTSIKRKRIVLSIITILFFVLTVGISQTEWGRGRFEQTSIFATNQDVDAQTQRLVFGSKGPVWLTRLFHNKAVVGGREFFHQYMTYFSGEYLLSKGGLPIRYDLPDQGLIFYGAVLILFLLLIPQSLLNRIGITPSQHEILKKNRTGIFVFLIYILLLTPIPSALTRDDVPNTHRTLLMSVMYLFPVVYGLARVSAWRMKRFPKYVTVTAVIAVMIAIEFIYFVRIYTLHADRYQALRRHDETTPLVQHIVDYQAQYDRVLVPTQQHMALQYLLLTENFSPEYAGQFRRNIVIDNVGKIEFYETDCGSNFLDAGEGTVLAYDRIDCEKPSSMNEVTTFKSALGVNVYRVVERR